MSSLPHALTVTAALLLALPSSASAAQTVSIRHKGTLSEVLERIADQGELNVVVVGRLDQPAELYLKDVTAEEALKTVARIYGLEVEQEGRIFTVRQGSASAPSRTGPADILLPAPPSVPAVPEPLAKRRHGRELVATGPVHVEEGQVVREAVSFGGPLTVDGEVERDAVVFGGGLKLGPKAVVGGNVVSFGGGIEKAPGARIEGDTVTFGLGGIGKAVADGVARNAAVGPRAPTTDREGGEDRGLSKVASFLVRFLLFFGMGFLFMLFFPTRMKQLEQEVARAPWRCGLTGMMGLFAAVPFTVLLVVTLIGIPFAFVLWALLAAGVVMGLAAVANWLGGKLPVLRARKTQALVLAMGLLVLLAVGEVPVLGVVVWVFLSLVATGAVLRTRFGARRRGLPETLSSTPAHV